MILFLALANHVKIQTEGHTNVYRVASLLQSKHSTVINMNASSLINIFKETLHYQVVYCHMNALLYTL